VTEKEKKVVKLTGVLVPVAGICSDGSVRLDRHRKMERWGHVWVLRCRCWDERRREDWGLWVLRFRSRIWWTLLLRRWSWKMKEPRRLRHWWERERVK